MTYLTWRKRKQRVLTNREVAKLDAEIDKINLDIVHADNDAWIEGAEERLREIESILRESWRLARIRELGLRVIQGGAA